MGYRDDGFFNINWAQDARNAGASSGGKQNSPFMYPDSSVRFLDAQSELQRKFNAISDTIKRGDYKIHRGYIRNLEQPQFGNVPISKCNFQFNPQEIRQNVAMREDVYLPLLQDTKQLQQPIGAVVNFTFDLLFDRSHEVSKGGNARSGATADQLERGLSEIITVDPLSPNPDVDPYDIGVLADLRILYSVIGQGFSREMLEFQKNTLIDRAERRASREAEAEGGDGTESTGSPLGNIDDNSLNEILEANYGNWGLLMPNPVRVMFSSLFMLDGFITGTNVDFLKFNTKMVPLMCRVTMNMSAMYIGFARQDTFLTKTFKDAAEAIELERNENRATKLEILTALTQTGNQFALSTAWDSKSLADWDGSIRNSKNPLPVWALAVMDTVAKKPDVASQYRALFLGFPNAQPVKGQGEDKDAILKLYQNGASFTISYSWDISIYGAINSSQALTVSTAGTLIANKRYTTDSAVKLMGKYSGTETATSEISWGKGASGEGADDSRVRRRSIRGGINNEKLKNEALGYFAMPLTKPDLSNPLELPVVPEWLKNAYYIAEINVNVNVTYGTRSDELSIPIKRVLALPGTGSLRYSQYLNWSAVGITAEDLSGISLEGAG